MGMKSVLSSFEYIPFGCITFRPRLIQDTGEIGKIAAFQISAATFAVVICGIQLGFLFRSFGIIRSATSKRCFRIALAIFLTLSLTFAAFNLFLFFDFLRLFLLP